MTDTEREIKVCGMTHLLNINELRGLPIDYMGFILYEGSPRYCYPFEMEPAILRDRGIEPVAVTVNMEYEELMPFADEHEFRIFQLHGEETPHMCRWLKEAGLTVWKAMPIGSVEDLKALEPYYGGVDRFVFDTKCSGRGGSGMKFDWSILDSYDGSVPFMLSGGIGPGDREAVDVIGHPMLAGYDLNSRFERYPGYKERGLVEEFVKSVERS